MKFFNFVFQGYDNVQLARIYFTLLLYALVHVCWCNTYMLHTNLYRRKRGIFSREKIMILFTEKSNPLGLKLLTVANFAKKSVEIKLVSLNGEKKDFHFCFDNFFSKFFIKFCRQFSQGTEAFTLSSAR